MTKPTFSQYLRANLDDVGKKKACGPFVTVSFEYGCDGSEIGQSLVSRINARIDPVAGPDAKWILNDGQFLLQYAHDAGMDPDLIRKERIARPTFFKDVLRVFRGRNIPDCHEIFKGLQIPIREAAVKGRCVILGQGSTAATAGLDNGLHIRLEGSREWKIARIACREGLDRDAAAVTVDQAQKRHKFISALYRKHNPRWPAFDLTLDNSQFTNDHIVDMILFAMEKLEYIPS
jgi:hypothetical protein